MKCVYIASRYHKSMQYMFILIDEITCSTIEHFYVTSSPSRLWRKIENSCHVGVQWDRSFYGEFHKMSDILLICVESDKTPLLHKLKQLYKRFPVGFFLIDIAYTCWTRTSCTPIWMFMIQTCDHMMKTLYIYSHMYIYMPWTVESFEGYGVQLEESLDLYSWHVPPYKHYNDHNL